jgi:hypothetical protein
MAVVQGLREKVHLPLYDSLTIEPEKQLWDTEKSGTLKFFVNVQGKNKLETNLQSASLLPHYNTFEARAMRVVISDLPPEFPDDDKSPLGSVDEVEVSDPNGNMFNNDGTMNVALGAGISAKLEATAGKIAALYEEANADDDGTAEVDVDDDMVTLIDSTGAEITATSATPLATVLTNLFTAGASVVLSKYDIEDMNDELKRNAIPKEQLDRNNGSGTLIGKMVYNTVTSLFVGEKVMISMPTWFFPGGAGAYSATGKFTTHGEPSPSATFRFAEPIYIDRQQNFRVEIEIPDADVLKDIQKTYGPMNIWVVLDGYMTRDVQ